MKLNNKNFLVVGSSRGIGLEISKELITEGAYVVTTGRNTSDELKNILGKFSDQCNFFEGDLTLDSNREFLLNYVDLNTQDLHGIIFNIGGVKKNSDFKDDRSQWEWYLNINLLTIVSLVELFKNHIIKSRGSMIFIGSIASKEYLEAPTAYSAAKSSINIFSKDLCHQLGQYGVRINTIHPGNILFKDGNWAKKIDENPNLEKEYIRKVVPLQKFGTTTDIAKTVSFLLSDDAKFITGASITVDGGQTKNYE